MDGNSIQVRNLAGVFLGTLDDDRLNLLSLVCVAVEQEIRARLRPDVDTTECNDVIVLASVLLAVAAMRQFEEGALADFTAGTLKVSFDNDRSAPVQMAMRLIAPWCADPFAFRGVAE